MRRNLKEEMEEVVEMKREVERKGQPESSSAFSDFIQSIMNFLSMFTFRNIRKKYRRLRKMTIKEIVVKLATFLWTILMGILYLIYSLV